MTQVSGTGLLLRQRFAALLRTLPGARAGDPRAIHQARVATRRLREALPLVTRRGRREKLERAVRRLTRALGPVRELDVALASLAELEQAGSAPKTAIACLRQLVLTERRAMQAESRKTLERVDVARLRRKALSAVETPTDAPASGRRPPVHTTAAYRRASRRATALRATIENAASLYLPDRLHEVRIAVKKLRYALEVTQQMRPGRTRRTSTTATIRGTAGQLAALKRAQELLGRMHDLEVLIARTRAAQGSPGAPNLRLSGELDRLVRTLETECRVLHGHYMASRAQLLQICDRVEQAAQRAA